MTAANLISRYNEFNGQPLTVEQLKAYRAKVQNFLDSVGHGPNVPGLNEIRIRITQAIKDFTDQGITDIGVVIITPVKIEPEKVREEKSKPDGSIQIMKALGELTKIVKSSVVKETPKQKKKIVKVLHEFKEKKLKTPQGKVVKKKKQAIAIALREAKVPKKRAVKLNGIGENKSLQPNPEKVPPTEVIPPAELKPQNLSGVEYDYYAHDLGEFQPEFHRLNSDANAMFHGLPGHGKTYKFLKLAKHFADQGKEVLYIAKEEFGRSTLKEKLNQLGIDDTKPYPHLLIKGSLDEKEIEKSQIIFFDSVQALKLTPEKVDALDKKYPNRTFFLIVQTTKDGDFKGGQDWEHLVDVAGEVVNRKLILRKNRFDNDNAQKEAELRKQEAIENEKKKIEIKQAVKESLGNTVPPAPVPQPVAA